MVEFLTSSFQEDEGVRPLAAFGVDAQSLYHLNYGITDPVDAVVTYRSGVLVQRSRPERFAIHKLMVANRRRKTIEALKAEKDRLQANFLITVLADDRPDELSEAFTDAQNIGPQWWASLDAPLERLPFDKAVLESL